MWKWKTVLAGTTALVIAGGGLALAQSGARTDTPRDQSRIEQINARVDARLARLKTRLQLTGEQEKHWPAVEAAIRELAKQRAARVAERRTSRDGADLIQRMRGGADAMTARAAGLKQLADAIEPLYKSLDERQRGQLAALMRGAGDGARGGRHAGGRHFGGGHRSHQAQHHGDRGGRGHHGYRGREGR
jgi:hypothetical protein